MNPLTCSCGTTYPGHLPVCPSCGRPYQPPKPPPPVIYSPPPPPPKSLETRIHEWLYENGQPPAELSLKERATYLQTLPEWEPTRRHIGQQIEKWLRENGEW